MALEGAMLKVERAKQHISELNTKATIFFSQGAYQLGVRTNSESTRRALFVEAHKSIPPDFGLIIGDAIHGLRSALDLATWEIVSPLGPKKPEKVQFPFVKDPKDFEAALASREVKRASKDIVDQFRAAKPYPRGNDDLFGLHMLDIADKHKVLTPSVAVLSINALDLKAIDPTPGAVSTT